MTNACALTCRFLCLSPPHPPTLPTPFAFSLIFQRKTTPATPLNPNLNPSPKDTNGNCHPFAKTTPGKNYPLVSARNLDISVQFFREICFLFCPCNLHFPRKAQKCGVFPSPEKQNASRTRTATGLKPTWLYSFIYLRLFTHRRHASNSSNALQCHACNTSFLHRIYPWEDPHKLQGQSRVSQNIANQRSKMTPKRVRSEPNISQNDLVCSGFRTQELEWPCSSWGASQLYLRFPSSSLCSSSSLLPSHILSSAVFSWLQLVFELFVSLVVLLRLPSSPVLPHCRYCQPIGIGLCCLYFDIVLKCCCRPQCVPCCGIVAVTLKWPGDSQRESGRLAARIDSRESVRRKKNLFS